MQAIVARHVLSPALLPGAAGRADGSGPARAAVVAKLASLLEEAGLDAESWRGEDDGPPVLVVAPARRSRVAVDARPDLGALGLTALPVRSDDTSPALGVTATVAVTLLRMSGWDGPVETVEVAGPADQRDDRRIDDVVSSALARRSLVLVALGSDGAELPAGAPAALAAAHVRVVALADLLGAASTVTPSPSAEPRLAAASSLRERAGGPAQRPRPSGRGR